MEIKKLGDIHEVTFTYSGKDYGQWVLLMSDEHYDSRDCDRKLLKKHLIFSWSGQMNLIMNITNFIKSCKS